MKHLASLINRNLLKAYIIWTLCFGILAMAFVFYGKEKQRIQVVQEQLYTLSQIDKEMSLSYVLYRDSQKTLDKLPPIFAGWLESRNRLLPIMPDMDITFRNLEKSGRALYALLQETSSNARPPAPAQLNDAYLSFRKQADSLEVPLYNFVRHPSRAELQVLGIGYWSKSLYYSLERGGLILLFVLWLLGFAVLVWSSLGAIRNIRIQSEEVLGILWTKLKNQDQESEELSFLQPEESDTIFDYEAMKENAYHLFEASRSLSQKLAILSDRVQKNKPDVVEDEPQFENIPKADPKEKLNYMQKLLARLFTRAERTASLAKAVGSNGFQAGILALNVSIEAARAGESGRPFLSVSDKVKDFGEKSSRISEAILEEIKDADVVIRRAYTAIKEIIETTPIDSSQVATSPKKDRGAEVQEWIIALESVEEILKSASYVQQMAQSLETKCLQLEEITRYNEPAPLNDAALETREAILQSFEKLYFFSYGDTPPSHVFRS